MNGHHKLRGAAMSGNSTEPITNSALEDGVLGLIWMLLSGSVLALYILPLIVIGTDHTLKIHSCYKMMFQLGLSDVLTLSSHFLLGLLTTFQLSYKIPDLFNRILGAAIEAWGWFMYTWLIHAIAINRFVVMCTPKRTWMIFGPKATMMWQGVCWLYALGWFVLLMSSKGGFRYYPESYSFYFEMEKPWFLIIKDYAWWQNLVNFGATTLWYIMIFVYMKTIKNRMVVQVAPQGQNNNANANKAENNQNGTQLSHEERTILKQAAIIGLYTVTYDQMWHFLPSLYYVYGMKYAFIFGNYCWITTCCVNPIVYLTINKTVSSKVKVMLGIKPNTTTTAVRTFKQSTAKSKG